MVSAGNALAPSTSRANWKTTLDATRSFQDVYVTTIIPCRPGRGTGVIVCTLDAAGQLPPHVGRSKKAAKVRIGTSTVLKIPNLSDDSDWIPAPIVTSADCAGLEVPLYPTVSPNAVMFCAFSNSPLTQTPSLYALPKPANASANSLSLLFCAALLSLRTTDDIAHVLVAQRDVDKTPRPVDAASQDLVDTHLMETLYITHRLLEKHARGAVGSANYLVAGLAIEVYRERAKKGFDLDYWRTEHDICSIAACNLAFEYCKRNSTGTGSKGKGVGNEGGYDLDSSWHLLALSTWIVNFLERLLRQCVVCSDSLPDVKLHAKDHALALPAPQAVDSAAQATAPPPLSSPILLHLAHPGARKSLAAAVAHVERFRDQLTNESYQQGISAARDVLTDAIDCSGISLDALTNVLHELAEKSNVTEAHIKSLVSCMPLADTDVQSELRNAVRAVSKIPDRLWLFIKPSDLVDGLTLDVLENPNKPQEVDVISKQASFTPGRRLVCLRCGGESLDRQGFSPTRWGVWERLWRSRCVCGGSWACK